MTKTVGNLMTILKRNLQISLGCISHFEHKKAVFEKTWNKFNVHMEESIELFNQIKQIVDNSEVKSDEKI